MKIKKRFFYIIAIIITLIIILGISANASGINNLNDLISDCFYSIQELSSTPTPAPTPSPTPSPIPAQTPALTATASPETPIPTQIQAKAPAPKAAQKTAAIKTSKPTPIPITSYQTPVSNWPSVTYIVKSGDSISVVAAKFGVPMADIIKYNYMSAEDWLNAGQKIAINGYAPRNFAVKPGESSAPARIGKLVDWFLDGQYLIKRNDVFLITDVGTGVQFKVKMMGGYNHSDVETLTATDTAAMQKLFPVWKWEPRPVVIFHNGMNIAASLSGMPHSYDTISTNNVSGHFDLYLYNSKSHGSDTSAAYVEQHKIAVLKAAGK